MVKISLIATIAFMSSIVYAEVPTDQDFICREMQTTEPPFYVSDEYRQGDRLWENLRNKQDPNKVSHYLPRGSIVYTPQELDDFSDAPDSRVPVQVLSVPSTQAEEAAASGRQRKKTANFVNLMAGVGKLARAEIGTKGFLDRNALRKAGDYTYMLIEDSPVFRLPNGKTIKNAEGLKLVMTANQFEINRCCTRDSFRGPEACFDHYKFQVIDRKGEVVGDFMANPDQCEVLGHVKPVPNNVFEPIATILELVSDKYPDVSIADLQTLPPNQIWSGRTPTEERPYLAKIPHDRPGMDGPHNTYHYNPDDEDSSDAYLRPYSQCAFFRVAEKFKSLCSGAGCQLQYGNCYHKKSWGVHVGHESAECMDLHMLRKSDDSDEGLTYTSSRYSQERTKEFLELAKRAGASTIFFNDPKIGVTGINRDSSGVHNDHIHLCFRNDNSTVQQTCRDGL
jgi:hypothetical protein